MNNTTQAAQLRQAGLTESEIAGIIDGRSLNEYNNQTNSSTGNNPQREMTMNLNSHLLNILSDASRHYNPDVAATAKQIIGDMQQQGITVDNMSKSHTNSLLSVMDSLNDATNNEFAAQSNMAADLARPIQQGVSDIQYAADLKKAELDSHSNHKEDTWKMVINPETGEQMEQHTGTGQVRVAQTADEMIAEATAQSQANFAQHLTDGYSADSFLDSADSSADVAMRVV